MSQPDPPPTEERIDRFEQFSGSKYFPCFDGLRACAVLWVLIRHAPHLGIPWLDAWGDNGDLGVDMFFVISGFLITTLILREEPAPVGSRLKRFYMRRSLRIFPVYYLAIAIYWLAARVGAPQRLETYQEFVPSLLVYLSDYRLAFSPDPFPLFGHAWSLAVEEKFYLFWPLLVMLLPERRALAVTGVFVAVGIGLRALVVATQEPDAAVARMYYAFDTRFDALMWGALLAFLLRRRSWYEALDRLIRPPVLVGAFVLLMLYTPWAGNETQLRYVAVPILSLVILTAYLLRPRAVGSRLLDARPMVYVGRISYGIYIFHPLAISFVEKAVRSRVESEPLIGWTTLVGGAVVSIALSALSFRFFESWFLKLKERFR
jgi:peptidoglycan/LPS O-acetylase OafA/YrhL